MILTDCTSSNQLIGIAKERMDKELFCLFDIDLQQNIEKKVIEYDLLVMKWLMPPFFLFYIKDVDMNPYLSFLHYLFHNGKYHLFIVLIFLCNKKGYKYFLDRPLNN